MRKMLINQSRNNYYILGASSLSIGSSTVAVGVVPVQLILNSDFLLGITLN